VGLWSQAIRVETVETGGGNAIILCYNLLVPHEQHNLQSAVFCEERFGKNHDLNVHLTYKDVDRFPNGWVHQFRARSRDITNKPCKFKLRKHWQKTMTTDLKTSYDIETNTSDVEIKKSRIVVNRASIVRQTTCNWIKRRLRRSNFNSKYLRVILVLKYPDSYI